MVPHLRKIFTALFVFISWPVAAQYQPCPSFTAGWALSSTPPITAVLYEQTTQIMYVVFYNTYAYMFYPVPTSTMQTFSQSKNFLQTYQTYITPRYNPILLAQSNNCPLLFENGTYIQSPSGPYNNGPTP